MKTTTLTVLFFRQFRTFPWAFKLAWLGSMDRWFIFRDFPDWYVQMWAHLKDSRDPEEQRFIEHSRSEWELRKRKRNRERPWRILR